MFRRRTDFSWPLILVLIGLFFLSLRLPRQWERIARPTALALTPHKSLPDKDLLSARQPGQKHRRWMSFVRSSRPARLPAMPMVLRFRPGGKRSGAPCRGRADRGREITRGRCCSGRRAR